MAKISAAQRQAQLNSEETDAEVEAIELSKEREAHVNAEIPGEGCKFVFIGDPRDAGRGPLFEVDEVTGREKEPPLRFMGLKFPKDMAVLVKDEAKIRKLRGNNHFFELKPGEDLAKKLAKLPAARRERRDNVNVATLGVASENPRQNERRMSRRERDMAEEFEGDGDRA